MSRRYRNRRIGEFLKELELTEGRSTGVPKIIKAMTSNGSPAPLIETDDDRCASVIRLPAHPLAQVPEIPVDKVTPQVTPQVERILRALTEEMTRQDLQEKIGLKDSKHFRKAYLSPALATELVELTQPGSSKQRYRLSALGLIWLQSNGEQTAP